MGNKPPGCGADQWRRAAYAPRRPSTVCTKSTTALSDTKAASACSLCGSAGPVHLLHKAQFTASLRSHGTLAQVDIGASIPSDVAQRSPCSLSLSHFRAPAPVQCGGMWIARCDSQRRENIDTSRRIKQILICRRSALAGSMLVSEIACGVLVGVLWGVTNPLIKRGGQLVEKRKAEAATSAGGGVPGWAADWAALLSTPSFLVPQVINQVRRHRRHHNNSCCLADCRGRLAVVGPVGPWSLTQHLHAPGPTSWFRSTTQGRNLFHELSFPLRSTRF